MVKWTKQVLQYYTKIIHVLVKPQSSSKILFRLDVLMISSIVVLSTQIQSIKMRSSKLIIKNNAQKQLAKSSFRHKFHDLKYFELGIFFVFLKIFIYFRASSNQGQNFINLILLYHGSNQIYTITRSISPSCTPLGPSSNMCVIF